MNIVIENGRIIDPANNIDKVGSVYISDGKIISLNKAPENFSADKVIDAHHLIVCPGFIELSARLREPGQTEKATIASETKAAAKAGVTSLCIPPDTQPIIDTPAVAELIHEKAELANYPNIYPIAAMTKQLQGKELASTYSLKQTGCIAVSQAQQPFTNILILKRAMEYAASHDLLFIYQPLDYHLSNHGCIHDGKMATRYGLPGIPAIAETIALMQCLELSKETGCRVHFSQLSCARSVKLLNKAKSSGLAVSADVAIHQLHITEAQMPVFDSAYHVIPPFRTEDDQRALKKALANGTIDALCSDHQPHDIDAKLGAFAETEAGISSLESLLPLMLALVNEGTLNLNQGISRLTIDVAHILSLEAGTLSPSVAADICIFDANKQWQLNEENWLSRGKNTPFWGKMLQGQVTHTIQAGKLIYEL